MSHRLFIKSSTILFMDYEASEASENKCFDETVSFEGTITQELMFSVLLLKCFENEVLMTLVKISSPCSDTAKALI